MEVHMFITILHIGNTVGCKKLDCVLENIQLACDGIAQKRQVNKGRMYIKSKILYKPKYKQFMRERTKCDELFGIY